MGVLDLKFDLLGERQVKRSFEVLGRRVRNHRAWLEEAGEYIHEMTREQFDKKGVGGRGGKWRKLTKRYKAWKEEHYPGMPLMVMTGRLKAAATNKDADGSLWQMHSTYLDMGVDRNAIPYARAHQLGNPANNLPQRRIFAVTTKHYKRITGIARAWLLDNAYKSGFSGNSITGHLTQKAMGGL